MSLILEALRKSEAERRRGQAPGLFVEQVRVPVRPSARTPAWAWALMLLLAGVLLAWGWREFGKLAPVSVESAAGIYSDSSATPQPIAQTAPPAPGNPQRVEGANLSPDAAPRTTDSADADARGFDAYPARGAATVETPSPRDDASLALGARNVATAPQGTSPPTPASTGSATRGSDAASARTSVPNRESGDTPANAGIALTTSTAPAITPANPSPAAASRVAPAQPPEDEYLPRLSELTGDERSGLPALKLSMHVYADDPAQRFVIVDGRRLREGDSPAAGIAVEAIRRDGLVLSVNGRRVLLARP
jgi:general secretion pathway protein B